MNTSTPHAKTPAPYDYSDWLDDAHPAPPAASTMPAPPPARHAAKPSLSEDSTRTATPAAPIVYFKEPMPPARIPSASKISHFPAFVSRSSLFGVSRPATSFTPTPPYRRVDHAVQGSQSTLARMGPALSQYDKAVWMASLDIAKEQSLDMSRPIQTSLRELGRRIGLAAFSGRDLDWIRASLARLSEGTVEAAFSNGTVAAGKLIRSTAVAPNGIAIEFDAQFLAAALAFDKQFKLDVDRRVLLRTDLAKWLHDFASTHAKSMPLELDYLRLLCGFDATPSKFPARLEAALLEIASAAPDMLASHAIQRGTRKSDAWTLTLVRGDEKPSYVSAKDFSQAPSHARSRRGGVAL